MIELPANETARLFAREAKVSVPNPLLFTIASIVLSTRLNSDNKPDELAEDLLKSAVSNFIQLGACLSDEALIKVYDYDHDPENGDLLAKNPKDVDLLVFDRTHRVDALRVPVAGYKRNPLDTKGAWRAAIENIQPKAIAMNSNPLTTVNEDDIPNNYSKLGRRFVTSSLYSHFVQRDTSAYKMLYG